MTRTAIISDIHGNLEALTSVLRDIHSKKIERIVCLGDVIGYGANPKECLDIVFEKCSSVVMGNHEYAILSDDYKKHLNSLASMSIEWASKQLSSQDKTRISDLDFSFRESSGQKSIVYAHGTPNDFSIYVREHIVQNNEIVGIWCSTPEEICFHGHSHTPGIILKTRYQHKPVIDDKFLAHLPGYKKPIKVQGSSYQGYIFIRAMSLPRKTLSISGIEKAFINVGSVGQPRDRDPRACYAIYNDETERVCWRRVLYDIETASKKIIDLQLGLDKLGERLKIGR